MATLASASSQLSAVIKDVVKRDFTVQDHGTLHVKSNRGHIEVTAIKGNSLMVEVHRSIKTRDEEAAHRIFKDVKMNFRQKGQDVFVELEYDEDDNWNIFSKYNNKLKLLIIIQVPVEFNVDMYTEGAHMSVTGITGEANFQSAGGHIHGENIRGLITANTAGGHINIISCDGNSDLKTFGGHITLSHLKGNVTAHSLGGHIKIDNLLGEVNANTSGGHIIINIRDVLYGDSVLMTSGGHIKVQLPEDIQMSLYARTSNGRIFSEIPVQMNMTVKGELKHGHLEGDINGGGHRVTMETLGGNINISAL